jgi:tRNA(Ile)-lysidine synthase
LLLTHAARPGTVEAATVDHGLRPDSAAEAEWVGALCRTLMVPHETLRVEVRSGNLQSRAREARYDALDEWLGRNGLDAMATAHHADDQAETLLMRLNRGSGLPGLAGVRPSGILSAGEGLLVRPLLGWRKSELETLVRRAGIEPIADPSNRDIRFDRVRIREALTGANWLDPLALARSAALLGEAKAALEEVVEATFHGSASRVKDGWRFALSQRRSNYIRVEVVGRIMAEMAAEPPRSEIARLVARLEAGSNASLAGVLATPSKTGETEYWTFRPEPPRKAG